MSDHAFMKHWVFCSLPESNIHEGIVYKIFHLYLYMLFWRKMTSHHLPLCKSEFNLAGSDASPLTMDSKHISLWSSWMLLSCENCF